MRPSATVSAAAVLPRARAGASLRAIRLLLAALLATALLTLPAGLGGATAEAASHDLVLAVEADDLGPEPPPRDSEGNSARELGGYEDPGLMFTWGAAFLLLGLVVTLLVVGGALWFLMVVRPTREA